MNVAWFSCGVSSAMVCYLCRNELDEIHYQHIDDQHPDSLRFLHDVERLVGKPIAIHQSPYMSVDKVCRAFGFLKGAYGARCTEVLKKRERKKWEREHPGRHTYFWGLDCGEKRRVDGISHPRVHGGGQEQMTTLFSIFALRGRDRDNPSLRGRSTDNYEQRMELVGRGQTCTITSVQKDNLVLEIYNYHEERNDR